MSNYHRGDLVKVKGQAVTLTIAGDGAKPMGDLKLLSVACIWFDREGHVQTANFACDLLIAA